MHNPDEDTEFNDALRAHGILPPKPPSREPSPDIPHITAHDALQAVASISDAAQLSTLLEGDNLDSDDERMFEDYRRRRVEEMRKEEKRGRFGSMEPLAREDFVKEVTEGSMITIGDDGQIVEEEEEDEDEDEGEPKSRRLKGTGVVVYLFKDSVPLSQHLRPMLNQLAAAHPSTKFLSIPAGLCIPNYPDKNCPTLLIYRDGEISGNVIAGMGLKGMKTTVRDLEGLLLHYRAIERPSAAIRASMQRKDDDDSDLEDDGEDGVGAVNSRGGGLRNGGGVGTGRGKREVESDGSDFDM
ncbi:hypothetical protein P7C73_g986, partial [Tremellales sp. Uapishka_1]